MLKMRAFFAIALMLFGSTAAAGADPIDLSATASVNFLDGYHIESQARDQILGPLPLAALDARYRRAALHLEALPPVTFAYSPNSTGVKSTRLSLLTATARYTIAPGTFAGAGITIYNQNTDRGSFTTRYESDGEDEYSRVAGARFEIGNDRRLAPHTALQTVFAINPVMNGLDQDVRTEHFAFPNGPPSSFTCAETNVDGFIQCVSTRAPVARGLPERASQIDTSATLVRHLRHGDLIAGVRYLNYVARYQIGGNPANLALADRNVGFMPLIAYRFRARP